MEEPIFSRQEQGVVYLFSRYWREIDGFQNKRITEIQVRFPDATMMPGADVWEAIEQPQFLLCACSKGPKNTR
jgi:hypothetical protein